MTTTQQRQEVVQLVEEAVIAGARRQKACEIIGLSIRTLQRWKPSGVDAVQPDRRPMAERPVPPNQLTTEERELLLKTCNQAEYASLPPSQAVLSPFVRLVPRLQLRHSPKTCRQRCVFGL